MNNIIIDNHTIQNKIFTIGSLQVMLDSNLTVFYGLSEIKIVEGRNE
jgi:hypothetical protein